MAHQSFRKDVLDKTLELAARNGGEIGTNDVSISLLLMKKNDHKRLLNTLSELTGEGKLRRVRQGVYAAPVVPAKSSQPEKREVMWRILRIRKKVTLDDLVEIAGVGRDYARQWLSMLAAHGVVRKIEQPGSFGVWLLQHDSVEMPVMDDEAARLRRLRLKKKAAMVARLDSIDTALTEVRQILQTMEEE